MDKLINTAGEQENAVLVGIITPQQSEEQVEEYLDELRFLAQTAGIKTHKRFTQQLQKPDVKFFVGKGKLEEVKEFIKENKIDTVIFDDDLSPSQLRNVERALKVKIYDRSLLILDIFQLRAKTAQAKTQVELARSQYLLPRLTRMWTHLERQRGGTGTRGGAGEKEIETDRRIIRNKITRLTKKLETIDKQMATQRKNRGSLVRVALVGYTNVGKSTLMNILSKSKVFAENKLFATLDTTVRKVVVQNLPFLLTDTVGFIRKLPHSLVESFKSTLDEVREADYLIHVVDISHPNFEEQIDTVNETLADIIGDKKPMLMVFNKIDQYTHMEDGEFDHTANTKHNVSLTDLKKSWMAKSEHPCIFISAAERINIKELRDKIYHQIKSIHAERFPYDNFLY
ncbi:GTPase HflX [Salibacter sp.]|uniref:GTPase HflX n=1 Tax=Salibacter sp. TaxID=2010995 RepID=UPI0028700C25|nr:GTPase HflX [Salibacter sp.]MDR9399175.1 GTPase HflX [Salibacter sp.]MDR9487951.1 GTPase HflX [Salibacter sp.]